MEIKNKFNVGDKVYAISQTSDYYEFEPLEEEERECPICNGAFSININGYEFNCPWCFNKHKYLYVRKPLEIIEICARICNGYQHMEYKLDYDDYDYDDEYFFESDLFLTLEEAITECKKRNAEMLAKYKVKGE